MLYAFDLLELDEADLRRMPLGDRKRRLASLLGGRRLGIVLSDHTDADGAAFRAECLNAHWFMSLDDARRKCEAWRRDYNPALQHPSVYVVEENRFC
jgi:hypothetical protein